MQVMVFSTSVQSKSDAKSLAHHMDLCAGFGRWNFALDDCDKILRVVSESISPESIIRLLISQGFDCQELADEIEIINEFA